MPHPAPGITPDPDPAGHALRFKIEVQRVLRLVLCPDIIDVNARINYSCAGLRGCVEWTDDGPLIKDFSRLPSEFKIADPDDPIGFRVADIKFQYQTARIPSSVVKTSKLSVQTLGTKLYFTISVIT